ncbi:MULTISPECIES: FAD-binding oxidoreductase [Nocardiopsis]|uniref:FAD-linked oxidase n=1 Tax=Nocardiopsis sinuspersici TaxID=501010 RepID=A0A1V3BWG3_9ACTN|nr:MULTISPECIES: FAD-binding oxidoreductase [Nocardiopsis]OOC52974.1 FAD-linked oxidase [Nocardiopsis sinuspersici]
MTLAGEPGTDDRAPRRGTGADAVGGLVPARVARPESTEALGRVMAAAAREGSAVVARGNGTALDWGGLPRRLDLLVDTAGLSWIEHIAGDLVVEVGAGTPVAELYGVLAAAGQRLSMDPVRAGGTVGGMVATGVSGPRRLLGGALRDLVIGMTVVRADGVVARSGGRVVKNVAGYDLAKLHTGGLGTLGVIASVALRLHPLPPALRVVSRATPSHEHAERALAELRRSTVVPSAVELDRPPEGPGHLRVVLEGTPDGVGARVAETARILGGDPEVADALPEGWGVLPAEGTLALVSVPPAESVRAAVRVGGLSGAAGATAHVTGSLPAGALYVSFPPGAGAEAVGAVADGVRSVPGWSMTLLRAEPHVHTAGVDLWGEVPGLPLMRAVKDSFDPRHRLAPGRFAGGI